MMSLRLLLLVEYFDRFVVILAIVARGYLQCVRVTHAWDRNHRKSARCMFECIYVNAKVFAFNFFLAVHMYICMRMYV